MSIFARETLNLITSTSGTILILKQGRAQKSARAHVHFRSAHVHFYVHFKSALVLIISAHELVHLRSSHVLLSHM